MLNENAKKWVAALRSGKYKQTRAYLENESGNCCLGVACRVAIENGVVLKVTHHSSYETLFDGCSSTLPRAVQDWLGLSLASGIYRVPGYTIPDSLIGDNDIRKLTFAQIADIIESEPEGLFLPKA